jgi:hypothetical protein
MPMYHEYNDCWQQHFKQMEQVAAHKPKTVAGQMRLTSAQVMPFDIMSTSVAMALLFATAIIAVVL